MAFAIRNPWDRLPGAAFIQGIVKRYAATYSRLWSVTFTGPVLTSTAAPVGWSYVGFFKLGPTTATSFPTGMYEPRATSAYYYNEDTDLAAWRPVWTGESRPPPNTFSVSANTGVISPPAVTSLPANNATGWSATSMYRASGQTSGATGLWRVGGSAGAYASNGPLLVRFMSGFVTSTTFTRHVVNGLLVGTGQWDVADIFGPQIRRTSTETSYTFSEFEMQMAVRRGNLLVMHWHGDGGLLQHFHDSPTQLASTPQYSFGTVWTATNAAARDPGFTDGEVIRIYAT